MCFNKMNTESVNSSLRNHVPNYFSQQGTFASMMCVPRREWSRTKLNKKKLSMSTTCSVCVAFDKTLVFASVWLGDPSKLSSRSSPKHLPASLQLIQSPPELSQSFLNLIWLDTWTPVFWKASLASNVEENSSGICILFKLLPSLIWAGSSRIGC